jgi:hypothetical protein
MKLPIKLQPDEKVELAILRSRASLLAVWIAEALAIGALVILVLAVNASLNTESDATLKSFLTLLMIVLVFAAILSGLVGTYLNFRNKMFITNRRVIYQKMPNLLSSEVKVINLTEIEDVSFKKDGLVANLFGFGTLRLSTESDETTYLFPYCGTPTDEIETITQLINKKRKNK